LFPFRETKRRNHQASGTGNQSPRLKRGEFCGKLFLESPEDLPPPGNGEARPLSRGESSKGFYLSLGGDHRLGGEKGTLALEKRSPKKNLPVRVLEGKKGSSHRRPKNTVHTRREKSYAREGGGLPRSGRKGGGGRNAAARCRVRGQRTCSVKALAQ